MRHLHYRFRALCTEVVHIIHCSVPVHHPIVAADAVTFVPIPLCILVLCVFLVLGEDQVLDMGMEWDLRVENFHAKSDRAPQPLGFGVVAIHLLGFCIIDSIEDCIGVIGRTRILKAQICCGESVSDLVGRLLQELSIVSFWLVVRVVPKPQLVIVLVRLLDSRFAEAMPIKGAIPLNIDELDAIILVSIDRVLDSLIECAAHFVEILPNFCRHFCVIFTVRFWVRSTSEGDTIAPCVDFIEEFGIAGDVQFELIANGPLSTSCDSLFDEMVDVVDQVRAVYQTPAIFPLVIAASLRWTTQYMGFEDAIEEYTGEIDIVPANDQSRHLRIAKFWPRT